jgi:hypothetical protein
LRPSRIASSATGPRDASTGPVAARSLTQFLDNGAARHQRCRRQTYVPAGNFVLVPTRESFRAKACGIA